MEGILGYVKVIENVEVPDIKPEYGQRNIWREDEDSLACKFLREEIISQFPDSQPARPNGHSGGDGIFVKVKKIL